MHIPKLPWYLLLGLSFACEGSLYTPDASAEPDAHFLSDASVFDGRLPLPPGTACSDSEECFEVVNLFDRTSSLGAPESRAAVLWQEAIDPDLPSGPSCRFDDEVTSLLGLDRRVPGGSTEVSIALSDVAPPPAASGETRIGYLVLFADLDGDGSLSESEYSLDEGTFLGVAISRFVYSENGRTPSALFPEGLPAGVSVWGYQGEADRCAHPREETHHLVVFCTQREVDQWDCMPPDIPFFG